MANAVLGEHVSEAEMPSKEGYVEAQAFASVHDLVHHAILSRPDHRAILKEIYATCEREGRIAYKHGKGSRLLTANEHWKSQIRHALYTSPRFRRVDDGEAWSVSNPEAKAPEPVTVRVYPGDDEAVAAQRSHEREEHKREKALAAAAALAAGVDLPHQVPHKSRANSNSRKRRFSNASTTSDDVSDDSPHKRNRRARHHAQGRAPLAEVAELAQTGQPTNNPWRKRDDEGRLHRALRRARENDRGLPRLVSRDSSPEPDGEHEAKRDDKPVIVMVGNKPVVPKGRDIAHNRRKPLEGHRAAMPSGAIPDAWNSVKCGAGASTGFIYHPSNEFITYHLGLSG